MSYQMKSSKKIPRTIPTKLLLEWAEGNRLLYIKMIEEARLNDQAVEAAHYMGSMEMVKELIFILSNLDSEKGKGEGE